MESIHLSATSLDIKQQSCFELTFLPTIRFRHLVWRIIDNFSDWYRITSVGTRKWRPTCRIRVRFIFEFLIWTSTLLIGWLWSTDLQIDYFLFGYDIEGWRTTKMGTVQQSQIVEPQSKFDLMSEHFHRCSFQTIRVCRHLPIILEICRFPRMYLGLIWLESETNGAKRHSFELDWILSHITFDIAERCNESQSVFKRGSRWMNVRSSSQVSIVVIWVLISFLDKFVIVIFLRLRISVVTFNEVYYCWRDPFLHVCYATVSFWLVFLLFAKNHTYELSDHRNHCSKTSWLVLTFSAVQIHTNKFSVRLAHVYTRW